MEVNVETPFPAYALPRIWAWVEQFRSRVADDFAPQTLSEFVAQQMDVLHSDRVRTWAVWRGDELGGYISVEYWSPVCVTSHCLFKREFWGSAVTEVALRQVYDEVFGSGVEKLVSYVFRDNKAIIALAKRMGAQTEGVLRKQTMRGGQLVDMVIVGLTKGDYQNAIHGGNSGSNVADGSGDWSQRSSGSAGEPQQEIHVDTADHADAGSAVSAA